jgi:hypothetical protein
MPRTFGAIICAAALAVSGNWQISLQKSVKNCRGLAANAGAARFLPLAPVGAAAATL